MKKQIKKLQLKKTVISILNATEKQQLKGGHKAVTVPYYSCKIECFPETWLCPPPRTEP